MTYDLSHWFSWLGSCKRQSKNNKAERKHTMAFYVLWLFLPLEIILPELNFPLPAAAGGLLRLSLALAFYLLDREAFHQAGCDLQELGSEKPEERGSRRPRWSLQECVILMRPAFCPETQSRQNAPANTDPANHTTTPLFPAPLTPALLAPLKLREKYFKTHTF